MALHNARDPQADAPNGEEIEEYTVMVWAWLPENQRQYGGSPEFAEPVDVEARSEESAIKLALAMFDATRGPFTDLEGEVYY